MPRCPSCHSSRIWKDGLRYTGEGEIQRYLCRNCGYRFSECARTDLDLGLLDDPNRLRIETAFNGSGMSDHVGTIHRASLKRQLNIPLARQIRAHKPTGAKNLAGVETRIKKRVAGATKLSEAEIKSKLVEFLWWMKKQGFPETTIKSYAKQIRRLHLLGADLMKPDSVLIILASNNEWSNSYKSHFVNAYDHWVRLHGLTWVKPHYRQQRKLPWIPTEEEIDQLIAGCGKKTATFLQLIKETAIRYREARLLKWLDVDFKKGTINIQSAKRGKPRELKISQKLMGMLNRLPRTSERVFGDTGISTMRNNLTTQRRRIADKLQNPRILRISFHTLRHWRASIEYHRGRKLVEIKEMLGHNSIQSTMIYTHLIEPTESDDWISRATNSLKGARALIEAGFEYVTDINGLKLFRKRK